MQNSQNQRAIQVPIRTLYDTLLKRHAEAVTRYEDEIVQLHGTIQALSEQLREYIQRDEARVIPPEESPSANGSVAGGIDASQVDENTPR